MPGTVMVVENETYILEAVETILESAGFKPIAAQSAREGMLIFQQRHEEIDLVILDWHLPDGLTGVEVLHRLQTIDPDVKILISTGYDERLIQQRLAPASAPVSILKKPYSAQTLLQVVESELGRGKTSGPLA
jgi:DNA-binding response OmpR family regulator